MRLQMKKKRIRINGEKESCVFLFFPRRLAKRAGALKNSRPFFYFTLSFKICEIILDNDRHCACAISLSFASSSGGTVMQICFEFLFCSIFKAP